MEKALLASGSELVTAALERVDVADAEDDILRHLAHPRFNLLPNTSGVHTAKESVFAAQPAQEALETNWLRLEIHPSPKYLLPDRELVQLICACRLLNEEVERSISTRENPVFRDHVVKLGITSISAARKPTPTATRWHRNRIVRDFGRAQPLRNCRHAAPPGLRTGLEGLGRYVGGAGPLERHR